MSEEKKKDKNTLVFPIIAMAAGAITLVLVAIDVGGGTPTSTQVLILGMGILGMVVGFFTIISSKMKKGYLCGQCERRIPSGEMVLISPDDPEKMLCKHCQ